MALFCLVGYIWAIGNALDYADLALEGELAPVQLHIEKSVTFGRYGFLFLLFSLGLFIVAKFREAKHRRSEENEYESPTQS